MIMSLWWWAFGLVVGLVVMEPWSRWVHGQLWHGRFERWHASHHRPREGRFEANDWLSFGHALLSVPMWVVPMLVAPAPGWDFVWGFAWGMSAFGIMYAVFHDGLAHGRLPVGRLRRVRWLARVAAAHRTHHATGGPPFGFFLGPQELRRHRAARVVATPDAQGEPPRRDPS
jgi:beta-carotene 3-hydroxylase